MSQLYVGVHNGGYVHARSEERRQDGSFEVLVGIAMIRRKIVVGDVWMPSRSPN